MLPICVHVAFVKNCWLLCVTGWLLIGLPSGLRADEREKPAREQWIVVTAPAFSEAVQPLCELRRKQGMHVVELSVERNEKPEALRDRIHATCRKWKGKSYVLLAGMPTLESVRLLLDLAGEPSHPSDIIAPAPEGTLGKMEGQPTDSGYGCLTDSKVPNIAVGRFPARSRTEVENMVAKTIAWESDQKPGAWKRRVTILAGAPEFNPMVDAMIDKLATGYLNPVLFKALDAVVGMPGLSEDVQRLFHLEMFMLCGDPAIRIPAMPAEVSMKVAGDLKPGATLTITGTVSPPLANAKGTLTLERRITSQPPGLAQLTPDRESRAYRQALIANHESANNFTLRRVEVHFKDRNIEHDLELPRDLPWTELIVRLYVANDEVDGLGVRLIRIQQPDKP